MFANLWAGRWRTLVTSAAFVEEPLPVAYGAALLATLGTAEARWGRRTRGRGVRGRAHRASLLVYAGLRGRVRTAPPDGPRGAIDVAPAYGFNATLGALAAAVPHRGRRGPRPRPGRLWRWASGRLLRRERTFTDAGRI